MWGDARRRGRAREILAFLGKKIGKLYFCAKVVSTFPLALFDHFLHDFQEKEIHIITSKNIVPPRGLNGKEI